MGWEVQRPAGCLRPTLKHALLRGSWLGGAAPSWLPEAYLEACPLGGLTLLNMLHLKLSLLTPRGMRKALHALLEGACITEHT
eukprot:1147010-Pelagomonas_calceolata.AAC.1